MIALSLSHSADIDSRPVTPYKPVAGNNRHIISFGAVIASYIIISTRWQLGK